MNLIFEKKLLIPKETKELLPITEEIEQIKKVQLDEIKKVLSGTSSKKLLIIGPCSADREDAVLEYLDRIKKINVKVSDKIVIIPRVFTNKPRSTGDGYKGMLHQPIPNGKPDLFKGILATRKLHIDAVKTSNLVCADEMLYPDNHRYFNDILGYVTIGARSSEDQYHRMVASGLEIPVGIKNPTNGNLNVLINSIHAAQQKHDFIYRGWAVHSAGNPYAHAVLRGYTDINGNNIANYQYDEIKKFIDLYKNAGLENPSIIIDCNHSNSNKNYLKQQEILTYILEQCKKDKEINQFIKGFMVESYLIDGNQSTSDTIKGQSITDSCLGWEKTEKLIYSLYNNL